MKYINQQVWLVLILTFAFVSCEDEKVAKQPNAPAVDARDQGDLAAEEDKGGIPPLKYPPGTAGAAAASAADLKRKQEAEIVAFKSKIDGLINSAASYLAKVREIKGSFGPDGQFLAMQTFLSIYYQQYRALDYLTNNYADFEVAFASTTEYQQLSGRIGQMVESNNLVIQYALTNGFLSTVESKKSELDALKQVVDKDIKPFVDGIKAISLTNAQFVAAARNLNLAMDLTKAKVFCNATPMRAEDINKDVYRSGDYYKSLVYETQLIDFQIILNSLKGKITYENLPDGKVQFGSYENELANRIRQIEELKKGNYTPPVTETNDNKSTDGSKTDGAEGDSSTESGSALSGVEESVIKLKNITLSATLPHGYNPTDAGVVQNVPATTLQTILNSQPSGVTTKTSQVGIEYDVWRLTNRSGGISYQLMDKNVDNPEFAELKQHISETAKAEQQIEVARFEVKSKGGRLLLDMRFRIGEEADYHYMVVGILEDNFGTGGKRYHARLLTEIKDPSIPGLKELRELHVQVFPAVKQIQMRYSHERLSVGEAYWDKALHGQKYKIQTTMNYSTTYAGQ